MSILEKLLSFLPKEPQRLSARDKFNQLMKELRPILKEYGYSRKGSVFRKRQGDNWGVIGFMKSKWNTQESVWFMIEIGVYSLAIDKQLGWDTLPQNPSTPDCHWRKELEGNVTDPGFEFRWDVSHYTSVTALTEAVKSRLLDQAIPTINNHITDEQLKDYWLNNVDCVISEFLRLQQLSILLKLFEEKDKLEEVLHKMELEYGVDDEVVLEHTQKMRGKTLQDNQTTTNNI